LDNGLKEATAVLSEFIKHSYLSPLFTILIYQYHERLLHVQQK